MNNKEMDKKAKCKKCNSPCSYTNPMAKCLECGYNFCFDHINAYLGEEDVEGYCYTCNPLPNYEESK